MIHWSLRSSWREVTPACCRGEESLTRAELAQLAQLRVPRRRAEWLLGRLTAKSVAAQALGDAFPGAWPYGAIEIACDPSGKPHARLAPEAAPVTGFSPGDRLPITLSISHTEGHALCAATGSGAAEGGPSPSLGVDLGRIEPRSRELVDTFFTEDERRLVLDAPPAERALRANQIWCAKEAVLKALGLGLTVDTRDLSCAPEPGFVAPGTWPLAPAEGAWFPFAATCGPALLRGGGTIHGIWRSFPGFVGALASDRPPVRLADDRDLGRCHLPEAVSASHAAIAASF